MDTFDRNVAIVGSAVYGGLLVLGMLIFAAGSRGEPFYGHPSASVAIFSVFWFAFSPSLLFIGATVPWLCALCGSRAAGLTFAIVPGGLFVLVGAYWATVSDKHREFANSLDTVRAPPWRSNAMGVGGYQPAPVAAYRPGDTVAHFPSPAEVAEMTMQRGSGAYAFPPPAGWAPGGHGGGGAAAGTTAFVHAAAAPPFVGTNWSANASPEFIPPLVSPAYGAGYVVPGPTPNWQYPAADTAAASHVGYGHGGGPRRPPPSAYVTAPPHVNVQLPTRGPPSSAYYVA